MSDGSRRHAMAGHAEPVVFQQPVITPAARARCVLTGYDYADQFTYLTKEVAIGSPLEWARAALEDGAGWMGQLVWRVLLGLRLERRSAPEQVAGWRIAAHGDTWITLEARSWMLTGNLVIELDQGSVSLVTFLRYERSIGARIWAIASPRHRGFAPGLLSDAHRVLSARS